MSKTTSTTPNDDQSNKSWKTYKEEGRTHYQNANYEEALISFQKAIQQAENSTSSGAVVVPQVEHEILLSNSVACRLKIGGPEMAFVAVEEAKKCVALNNKWAKAHIRLASAYIALGNHSNDACQSLQNALKLDPSNPIAKQMLMKELRRDRIRSSSMGSNHGGSGNSDDNDDDGIEHEDDNDEGTPIYVNENDYTNNNTRPSAPPMDQTSNSSSNNNNNRNDNDLDIDDSPTIIQRIQNTWTRFYYWYIHDASDSWKSLIRVLCLVLVLYIAFGGRFGLESALSSSSSHRNSRSGNSSSGSYGRHGDYGEGNAYEQFYKNQRNNHRRDTATGGGGYDRYGSVNGSGGNSNSRDSSSYNNRNDRYHDSYGYNNHDRYNNNYNRYDDDYVYGDSGYGRNYGSYGRRNHNNNNNRYNRHHSNSDWDTLVPYLIVGGLVLGLNRLFGVPIHVMPMGFGMRRGFGGGFGGVGFGGGGFGPRVRFGRGGMRFGFGPGVGMGGYPMGGGVGGRARFGRRRWY